MTKHLSALTRAPAALALAFGSAAALAHGGHPTPAGVSPVHHLHLSATTVAPVEWLLVAGLAVAGLGALALRRRGKRRTDADRSV